MRYWYWVFEWYWYWVFEWYWYWVMGIGIVNSILKVLELGIGIVNSLLKVLGEVLGQ